jgi:hypothetical protein
MEKKELIELINTNQYDRLEELIAQDDSNDAFIELCNAFIHESEGYNGYSLLNARKIYEKTINREDSLLQSFYFFALHLLRNKNDTDKDYAINTLKKGLNLHPSNERILYLLLTLLKPENISDYIMSSVQITEMSSSEIVLPYILVHCFNTKDYRLFVWLDKSDILNQYKRTQKFEIALIIGLLYYANRDVPKAKIYLSHVASYDDKGTSKKYALLGKVLAANEHELVSAIEDLPMTFGNEPLVFYIDSNIQYLEFEEFLNELFDRVMKESIVKDNNKLTAKIRGIRGYLKFDTEQNGGISDLKYAIKHFRYKEYYYALNMIYYYKENYKEAFKYGIEYLYYATPEEKLKGHCSFVIPKSKNEILELIELINSSEFKFYDSKPGFFKVVVSPVIEALFEINEYSLICEMAQRYDFQNVVEVVGFEVAYSYEECGKHELSKKYYEFIVNDSKLVSAASLNNLAFIYSTDGDYEQAIVLRKEAVEKSNGNEDYKKRLNDEIDKYNNVKNIIQEDIEATTFLMDENGWVLNVLNDFYEHQNEDGYIICSYNQLPKFMHLNKIKADEMIHYFMDKNYLRKISQNEHRINTQSTVYKVNNQVYKALMDIFTSESCFNDIIMSFDEFTPNKLIELGYTDEIIKKVEHLQDTDLSEMVKRDLRENLIAMITKSYKSSLVIIGSIVEAIIMYVLKNANIEKYTFSMKDGREKTIKIEEMSLSQLITAAEQHRMFTHETLKHSDAIRGYRNLIHPGVEVRKSQETPIVTEDNVQLAWMVLKKVISEI